MTKNNDTIPAIDPAWQDAITDIQKIHPKIRTEFSSSPAIVITPAPPQKNYPLSELSNQHYSYLTLNDSTHLDKKLADKVRRGHYPITRHLDLHGFTHDKAFLHFEACIVDAFQHQERCLCVVTGKGSRSETGKGVLQSSLPSWINSPTLRPMILMYCHAQQQDGGSGAFYILLRRKRND